MVLICPRIHAFEINDQSWFPQYLREKVQDSLTLIWALRVPPIQSSSPAQHVASTLLRELAGRATQYTYVDFCAGAGGPTPTIERLVNAQLASESKGTIGNGNGTVRGGGQVDFVLTDLHPHLDAWEAAAKRSDHLGFVAESVDAANAPRDLIKKKGSGKKMFRLYNLAFHHFDDGLAERILRNTVETADGFGIFELQNRTISSFFTVCLLFPLLLLITPFYFWDSPGHLFFTYIIPIIPTVVWFDGMISSLRTRSADEVLDLLKSGRKVDGWTFRSGSEMHAPPFGEMLWLVGVKEGV